MTRFDTLIDAATYLLKRGFRHTDGNDDNSFLRFSRGSWQGYLERQKNGRWKLQIL